MARSRAAASFDRRSWMKAVVIASTTIAAITTAARTSPKTYETDARVSNNAFNGLRARLQSSSGMVALRSRATRFGPNFFRRSAASAPVRPSNADPNFAQASSGGSRLAAASKPVLPAGTAPRRWVSLVGLKRTFMNGRAVLGSATRHPPAPAAIRRLTERSAVAVRCRMSIFDLEPCRALRGAFDGCPDDAIAAGYKHYLQRSLAALRQIKRTFTPRLARPRPHRYPPPVPYACAPGFLSLR